MKRLMIFLLFSFIFCLFSFSHGQTAKMHLTGKAELLSNERVGKRDSNGNFCAAIQVISDMDGFSYQSNNGVEDVDDAPGRDMVYLQAGERVLEIYKSGYEPLRIIFSEIGINLEPQQVWKIKVTGEAKPGNTLMVTFFVQPQDAQISINGKRATSGQAVKLSKGSHNLRISREGYKTKEETITVSEQSVVFNYTLSEVQLQAVQIKSVPTEAQILFNGQDEGLTDKGLWQYPGSYRLKLIKPGYVEIDETITVTEGGNNIFSYRLEKNSGTLSLNMTPTDSKVLINKKDYSGRSAIELAPGRYKIELSKSGYRPESETITIERGQTLTKTYNLTARTGRLQFSIQPLNASVTLKRNGRNVDSWSGMKMLNDLPVGSYELECQANGYDNKTRNVTIAEDKTEIVDIELDKRASTQRKKDLTGAPSGATGTVTDIDGNVYKTVKIGNQVWMAENLKVTRYRNGDPIPNVTSNSQWKSLRSGAYCNYDNKASNAAKYGCLYNWFAVNDSRNIAPEGWHVPTDEEWKQLEMYLGMSQSEADDDGWRGTNEGDKLKATSGWYLDGEGTNESGFTALPGGYRKDNDGTFYPNDSHGRWWSATESGSTGAWHRYLHFRHSDVYRGSSSKRLGFSLRLVRD